MLQPSLITLCQRYLSPQSSDHPAFLVLFADSEHSAIFQCIQGLPENGLRRIILTASGGAFRDWPVEKLQHVKVGCHACAALQYGP